MKIAGGRSGSTVRYAVGVNVRLVDGVPLERRLVAARAGYRTFADVRVCGGPVAGYVTRRFKLRPATLCTSAPGANTDHEGFGPCRRHGGNRRAVRGAWRMARSIADELNVSPWDALLAEVRRSAGRCAWLDRRVAEAAEADDARRQRLTLERAVDDGSVPDEDDAGLPPGLRTLLRESRNERRHLAVVAKAAIDAGVAERLVRQVELEGQLVATALLAGLDALELTADQRTRALEAANRRLLAIGPSEGVIDQVD